MFWQFLKAIIFLFLRSAKIFNIYDSVDKKFQIFLFVLFHFRS